MELQNLQEWYPFFWSLLMLLAMFGLVVLDILTIDTAQRADKKRTKIRDRLHFAAVQNKGAT